MRVPASSERSRGRGGHRTRVAAGQAAEWLGLVEQGMTLRQIADRAGIKQIRTIDKHVDRAREAAEDAAVRRDVLRAAVEEHQRDLARTAAALREELIPRAGVWFEPQSLSAAEKPLAALLAHTAGSKVPALMRAWEAVVAEYDSCLASIERTVETAARALALDVAGTVTAIMADAVAYGRSGEFPRLLPWRDQPEADGLWYGAFRILGGELPKLEPASARTLFEKIRAGTLEDAEALRMAQRKALSIGESLSDVLDDVTLRHYVAGSCRWCPGRSPTRRPRAGRARS